MNREVKRKIAILLTILVAVCIGFVYQKKELLFENPFLEVNLENIVYAAKDAEGNMLVLDDSGSRLLKISPDLTLLWETYIADTKGFLESKRVTSTEDGTIYVQTLTKEFDGYRICNEKILEYSSNGKFIREVVVYEYEKSILAPKIAGVYPSEDGITYIYKQDDAFALYDEDAVLLRTCTLDNAAHDLCSLAISRDRQQVYYVTYTGNIYQYKNGITDDLLYESAAQEMWSIPKEISCAQNGTLYVTDLGTRDVFLLYPDGEWEVIAEDLDYYDKEIAYYLNADYGLLACTNYSVKNLLEGEYEYIISCTPHVSRTVFGIVVWVATIVIIAYVMAILFFLLRYIVQKGSRFVKISAGLIAGVLFMAIVFVGILMPQFREHLFNGVFSRADAISMITAKQLPLEAFASLDRAADFNSSEYTQVKEVVSEIFLSDSENVYNLYCTLYRIQGDVISSVYCLQEDTGAIYPYDWYYEDSDEQLIMQSGEGKQYKYQTSEGSYLFVLNPIIDENGEAIGLIEVGADLNSFEQEIRQMILELMIHIVAITVVIILIGIEFILYFQARAKVRQNVEQTLTIATIPTGLLRMIVFFIFFLTNIATGFLPIYALKITEAAGGFAIPAEILAAIPISAEVLAGAIFSIFGNKVIEKFGEKKSAVLAAIVFSIGFVFRIIPNIWLLTLGNAVLGIGWGILLLLVNTILAQKSDEEKDSGFAAYSAAALNGINCGVVFGGFLINWFSYQWIFVLCAIASLFVYHLSSLYLGVTGEAAEGESAEDSTTINVWKFLSRGKIVSFFVMIVVPIIACSYFLNYMFPILASDYGMAETNIGYSYLLNGLCVICFSNVLTNLFSKRLKKTTALVLASCLYAVAFFVVAWYQSIPALLIALVLLGLSDGFGLPLQTSYYTDLDEVKEFGYDRAIGIYSLFENGAQTAGSFIFSYVLLIGVKEGLLLVITLILILAFIFLLSSFIKPRKKATEK